MPLVLIRPDPAMSCNPTRSGRYAAEDACNDYCLLDVHRSDMSDSDHDRAVEDINSEVRYVVTQKMMILAFELFLN